MNASPLPSIYEYTLEQLEEELKTLGQPAFRAKQIYRQLYVNLAADWEAMTDLPAGLRNQLAESYAFGSLKLSGMQKGDGGLTRKSLFTLPGGEYIESVLMLYPGRATVCISCQAGCPMGCVFCATAKLGFMQDLTPGQIVEQVIWAKRETRKIAANPSVETGSGAPVKQEDLPADLNNIVYMGMGEPFNNYDAWWASVLRINDSKGLNLGARNITVSTVGLVPGIDKLAAEPMQINLAISLHASDDELRSEMMPVNKAYPIQTLLESARNYVDATNRRISFEYVLLSEKNDTPDEAEQLATLLAEGPMGERRQLMHINLIPWNPIPGTPLERSSRQRVSAFQDILRKAGIPCTVRQERGRDIAAACGQLAGSPEAA